MRQSLLNGFTSSMLVAGALFLLGGCKKNETGPPSIQFDQAFIGVWYSDSNSIGFEVLSDGSSKTLTVDSTGRIQYSTSATAAQTLSLTLISGAAGNLEASVHYHIQGFIDTTLTIAGTYTFSNNDSVLTIRFPNPAAGGQIYTAIFRRTSIGAVVRTGSKAVMRKRSRQKV